MLLVGMMVASPEIPPQMPLQTLAKRTYSGVRERLEAVIKTEEAWRALW